jgi:tetrahydromethanopterin S-methyltransferase subunit G
VLGLISGPAKLYRNNGDMTFTEVGALTVDGKKLEASDGGPCAVDWDEDGILDLILGDDEGNVRFYKGTAKGSLALVSTADSVLLPDQTQEQAWQARKPDPTSRVGITPARPATRVKPFVADWNGDGQLDLLVGDFTQIETEPKKLTEEEQKRLAELDTRLREVQAKLEEAYERIMAEAYQAIGKKVGEPIPSEDVEKFRKAQQEAMKKEKGFDELQAERGTLYTEIGKLRPRPEATGFVWVYLRK